MQLRQFCSRLQVIRKRSQCILDSRIRSLTDIHHGAHGADVDKILIVHKTNIRCCGTLAQGDIQRHVQIRRHVKVIGKIIGCAGRKNADRQMNIILHHGLDQSVACSVSPGHNDAVVFLRVDLAEHLIDHDAVLGAHRNHLETDVLAPVNNVIQIVLECPVSRISVVIQQDFSFS